MRRHTLTMIILLSVSCLLGQETESVLEGSVSFITSGNVYVKFNSTEAIKIGDILQLSNSDCLKVENKSSSSVVCVPIGNCIINTGDTVTYTIVAKIPVDDPDTDVIVDPKPTEISVTEPKIPEKKSIYTEEIRGRFAAASYNTFSNVRDDRHRLLTRFTMNGEHLGDSKFSIQSNLAYRNIITPSGSRYNGRTSILNVYDLNVRFDATPTLSLTAGRKINQKASTIGAIDGLQVEKYFGNFYAGVVGGFRPDFFDFGFNSDLLQYGGYVGIESKTKDFFSQTTVGAIEQTNNNNTDRRYVFFQHYSTIASNLNLFGSMELDIFGNSGAGSRLTNLYLSARYRFSRAANFMLSYDSRKQIIYYETFQTDIERILDDDLARQGLRARLNFRIAKPVWAGLSYSSRFQSDQQNKSDNFYGYASVSKIPKLGGRFNVSYNRNTSNYLTSNIMAVRYSRELAKNKVNGDIYFRRAAYAYENRDEEYDQNYYGLALTYRFDRTWMLSISGEMSQLDDENGYRFYTRLIKRFSSKKKNRS